MQKIVTEPMDLMKQAADTADTYFDRAVAKIDELFGTGFAKKNPSLIGWYMKTCAQDFHTAALASVIQDIDEHMREALQQIAWNRGEN